MDIRNVGSNGNIDRSGERTKRADANKVVLVPTPPRDIDDARISAAGREKAAEVEGLAERARRSDTDRAELVRAATDKLINGELDSDAVLNETAQRLLDRGFLSA